MDMYEGDRAKYQLYSQIGIGPNVSFSTVLGDRRQYRSILVGVHAGYNLIFNSPASHSTINGWLVTCLQFAT